MSRVCGAVCPDQPFAVCDMPAGHPPIDIRDAATGALVFHLDHHDSRRDVYWHANGVFEFNGSSLPEPSEEAVDALLHDLGLAAFAREDGA